MNKTVKAVTAAALTVAALVVASGAEAALVERLGGKAIYDDVANLTWLQDANYAQTSEHDSDGRMKWADAMAWVGGLNIDGVSGWRLPGGDNVNYGFTNSSEMGNVFYNVLGGAPVEAVVPRVASFPPPIFSSASHNANFYLFKNIQSEAYWSGVEADLELAWAFGFMNGYLYNDLYKHSELYAWAVHEGDVGASPVPLPAGLFLLAPTLAGLRVMRRRAS